MRGVVKLDILPTAVASSSDHYVLVEGDSKLKARFWTVEEVARSMGVASDCSVMKMLKKPTVLTANQAVECLGRAINARVAEGVIHFIRNRGGLRGHVRYASAFS